jgi:phage gp36-like protein
MAWDTVAFLLKTFISHDIKEVTILNRTHVIKEKVWELRIRKAPHTLSQYLNPLQYWTPYEINFIILLVFCLGLHKKGRKIEIMHLYVTI